MPRSAAAQSSDAIEAVRRFSRFYTSRMGLLGPNPYGSQFSLTEVRVLYELAHRDGLAARDLARDLKIDAGYISRILERFRRQGLVRRMSSPADGRASLLALTAKGRKAVAPMERASRQSIGGMIAPLSDRDRSQLSQSLASVERLLDGGGPAKQEAYILRPHRPGDMGWVISAHGEIYAEEFGWNIEFEAFVAEIAAKFIKEFDPVWENCWIAEKDGERIGAVFVVRHSKRVAKLRMLIVDPRGRGLGLGRRLVEECLRFARAKGYAKMVLWTNSVLTAARAIYIATGFKLVAEEKHHSFGVDLVGETWELEL